MLGWIDRGDEVKAELLHVKLSVIRIKVHCDVILKKELIGIDPVAKEHLNTEQTLQIYIRLTGTPLITQFVVRLRFLIEDRGRVSHLNGV